MKLKKFISLAVITSLLTSQTPVFATTSVMLEDNNQTTLSFETTDKVAREKFDSLVASKKALTRFSNFALIEEDSNATSESELFYGDFEDFNSINENVDAEVLYENNSIDKAVNISYYHDTDTYVLVESDVNSSDVKISIDDQNYTIAYEDGLNSELKDLYIYSEHGEKMPLITYGEMIVEPVSNEQQFPLSRAQSKAYVPGVYDYNILNDTFKSESYNAKTTSTAWLSVLSKISLVTGGISIKANHPVLGLISWALAAVVEVGSSVFVTTYIQIYRAFGNNYYNYVRDNWKYYQYNSYTGYLGQVYRYSAI